MAVIQKFRKSFGKSFLQTPLPDLVEIQYGRRKARRQKKYGIAKCICIYVPNS